MLNITEVSIAGVETAIRVAAILVGGVWVYFKFARGRTFRPRLELTLSGTPTKHPDPHYVLITYAQRMKALMLEPGRRTIPL